MANRRKDDLIKRGAGSYEYQRQYQQQRGLVRFVMNLDGAVKEEIRRKAEAAGTSMTDWILSQLGLESYTRWPQADAPIEVEMPEN